MRSAQDGQRVISSSSYALKCPSNILQRSVDVHMVRLPSIMPMLAPHPEAKLMQT